MAQKQQQQFGLTRFTPSSGSITPVNRTYPLTNAERRGAIETRQQLEAIEQDRLRTVSAQQAVGDVSSSYHQVFTQTAERIWEVKNQAGRAADLQQFIDAAAVHIGQRCAAYLEEVTDAGVRRILQDQALPTIQWRQSRFSRKLRDE